MRLNNFLTALQTGQVAASGLGEVQAQIFNAQLDAVLCVVFLILVSTILLDSLIVWIGILRGNRKAVSTETPFVASTLGLEEV